MHVTTITHLKGWFTNATLSVEFVESAIFFAVCFQRSQSRKLDPNRPNSNHPIVRDYLEILMEAVIFFRPIQLVWCPLGWVAVLLRLFFVVDAGNAVQKELTKKSCPHAGLNCGPCSCEAQVITTTPWWRCGILVVIVQIVDCATCL